MRDGFDLLGRAEAWCVEDVGTGLVEGLEARDRVVEIGIAADVVLGAGSERERKAEGVSGFGCGRYPLDRKVEFVDVAARVVVLDRAADRAGFRNPGDRERGCSGSGP